MNYKRGQISLDKYITNLAINEQDKEILLNLTPGHYIGLAEKIAKKI